MLINILYSDNGVGLTRDCNILYDLFTSQGHQCRKVDIVRGATAEDADLNIFCEVVNPAFFQFAKKNYLIPNPEWFYRQWLPLVQKFDLVLCKTKEARQIFNRFTQKTVFMSFTSKDMYLADVERKREFIHVGGKSTAKNTPEVIKCWARNTDLPPVNVYSQRDLKMGNIYFKNIHYISGYVEEDQFKFSMNLNLFHVCPSITEGFGHYYNEARSTGAIIISTDASPMNEFIQKEFGFLVKPVKYANQQLAQLKYVNQDGIYAAVLKCLTLNDDQIIVMQQYSRKAYLDNDIFFKETISNIVN